ncbi:hypothetical protein P3T34_005432 [Kitasatospora sp. MAP12-44]|nr:hypothetical protein [Kitasatospora sp. MAP12-44]
MNPGSWVGTPWPTSTVGSTKSQLRLSTERMAPISRRYISASRPCSRAAEEAASTAGSVGSPLIGPNGSLNRS